MTTYPPDWKGLSQQMGTSRQQISWPTAWCTTDKLQHKHHLPELALSILSRRSRRCHQDHLGCQLYLLGFYLPTPLSDETTAEHLSLNRLTSEWNLNICLLTSDMKSKKSTPGYIQGSTDNNKQEIHSNCSLTFRLPVTNLPTRWCKPHDVRRYSDRWEDAEVKAQCEAYTTRVCSGTKTYSNHHCLLCNNLDAPKLSYYPFDGPYPPETLSHTMLLDWRRIKRGARASSEIYDTLSCVCRKVFIGSLPKIMRKNSPS